MDEQSHPKTKHLVVYDGRGKLQAEARIDLFNLELNDYVGCEIPFNTGAADGGPFYGHRIYAAFAHLVNCDYVFFCDEDNWYEPDHVANAIAVFEKLLPSTSSILYVRFFLLRLSFFVKIIASRLGYSPRGRVDALLILPRLPFDENS